MKISVETLRAMKACEEGIEFFKSIYGSSEVGAVEALLKVAEREPKYSVWWLTQTFTKPENVELVIFSARMVLPIFEEEIPKDDRPRKAIEAAEVWLDNPTEENELAAYHASYAAYHAAYNAAYAYYAASSYYAASASAASSESAAYADAKTYKKIIEKGIMILQRREEKE